MKGSDGDMPMYVKWAAECGADRRSMWGPAHVNEMAARKAGNGYPDVAMIILASFKVMVAADKVVHEMARNLDKIEGEQT